MKQVKISLTAIAFILGIGAAFATNFSNNAGVEPCDSDTEQQAKQTECPGLNLAPCCIVNDPEPITVFYEP